MTLENQKQSAESAKQYYEILRCRQLQIISIIKDTTELLGKIDASPNSFENGKNGNQLVEKNLDSGVKLAFGMINALANILDEQMKALNIWERLLVEDKPASGHPQNTEYGFQNYYEINPN